MCKFKYCDGGEYYGCDLLNISTDHNCEDECEFVEE
jgi:hypothetical protein